MPHTHKIKRKNIIEASRSSSKSTHEIRFYGGIDKLLMAMMHSTVVTPGFVCFKGDDFMLDDNCILDVIRDVE